MSTQAARLEQDDADARPGIHGTFFTGSEGRYPGTIIGVKDDADGRAIAVQFDYYRPIPGKRQRYLVWRNKGGRVTRFVWSCKYGAFCREDGIFILGMWEAKEETLR